LNFVLESSPYFVYSRFEALPQVFLTEAAPLQLEEVRVRVMAAVAELSAGRIEPALVDRVIGLVPV